VRRRGAIAGRLGVLAFASAARVVAVATVVTVVTVMCAAGSARAQVAPPAPETIAVGDWQLAPLLEARVRGEYWHDLDGVDRGELVERTRLGIDASRGPVEARVVFQDARLWDLAAGVGTVAGPAALATTGVYEAFGEAHTAGARPSFVRLGRQAVTWGEGRLLGANDWAPAGRALDALRGRLVVGDASFEALAAMLSDPAQSAGVPPLAYGELFGARGQWSLDPIFAVEAYVLARLVQAMPPARLDGSVHGQTYTGALRLHGDAHAWTWGAEGALQLGRADLLATGAAAGPGGPPTYAADRLAWAAAGHVAYTFQHVALLPTARLGVAYASGDAASSTSASTYHAFDPLLPDVHSWHGAMSLFAWSNEAEASARASIAPWADGVAAVEYRYARLAENDGPWRTGYLATIGSNPANTSPELGHEIDAVVTWSPWVPVDLAAGYSLLVLGDGARAILASNVGGGGSAPPRLVQFASLQATLRIP
jgi:hypothetical protein